MLTSMLMRGSLPEPHAAAGSHLALPHKPILARLVMGSGLIQDILLLYDNYLVLELTKRSCTKQKDCYYPTRMGILLVPHSKLDIVITSHRKVGKPLRLRVISETRD